MEPNQVKNATELTKIATTTTQARINCNKVS